ncbi:MAG: hypothetical protein ABJD07_08795 [Gemmatimonadaceae bacterium]
MSTPWRRLGTIGAVLLLAGSAAGFGPGTATEMKSVEVIDPLFNRVAFRVTIPADWVFDGTVLREGSWPMFAFRASSPDRLSGLQLLPMYRWVSTNDSTERQRLESERATIMPYITAADFVTRHLLADARPGATVIGPEAVVDAQALTIADYAKNRAYDVQMTTTRRHQRTDAARFRIAYEIDGHPVDEAIIAIKTSTSERRGMEPKSVERTTVTVTAARAPRGALDSTMSRLVAVSKSISIDTAWMARQYAFARDNATRTAAPSDVRATRDNWILVR